MIWTIVISLITFVSVILSLFLFPKNRIGKITISTYWVIALTGAIILLAFSFAPIGEVWKELTSDTKINPLKILVLFFSMTLLSIFLDEFGLFHYLANIAVKRAKGNQYAIFFSLYALVAALTIVTSNDIVILTLTPFICFFCKRAKINPLPYLIAEFTAANTWSLMLIIGNPTNIYLATSANITFVEYFKVMAMPTIAAGLVEFGLLFLIFRKKLSIKIEELEHDDFKIENLPLLIVGVAHLVICLVFLIISNYLNIEMWIVSAICAGSLLVCVVITCAITKKSWMSIPDSLKRLPYPLIPFFLSMFVIVVAFNYQGISVEIAKFFGETHTVWIYGYTSFITSNLINNIPMSILYSELSALTNEANYRAAIYSSIVGSNIGAFLTPMGALAGIMFTGLLSKHEVKFSFIDFVKYGAIIALPTITIALLVVNFLV